MNAVDPNNFVKSKKMWLQWVDKKPTNRIQFITSSEILKETMKSQKIKVPSINLEWLHWISAYSHKICQPISE